jgi:hypothetical protein
LPSSIAITFAHLLVGIADTSILVFRRRTVWRQSDVAFAVAPHAERHRALGTVPLVVDAIGIRP